MRLLVLGQISKEEQHFLDHAARTGYTVSVLTPILNESLQEAHITVLHEPLLTEKKLSQTLGAIDAVIVTASCAKNLALVRTLAVHMKDQRIRRLLVITHNLEQPVLVATLKATTIDWTIIGYTREKNNFAVSMKDLARFLVSQITEVQHLRSAVLVTN